LLALILVACADDGSGASGGGSKDPAAIRGIEWNLDRASIAALVDGVPPGAHVTLLFLEEQAHGTSACNSYGGDYRAGDDGSLSFDGFAVTEMACEQPLMALESAYLDALSRVTGFAVGDTLVLKGGGVKLTFERAVTPEKLPLTGTTWRVTSIADGEAVSSVLTGSEVTASFDESGSTIAGTAGCNRYSGTYTEGGGGMLSFSALAATKMMCAEDVMAQESAFLAAMGQVARFEIDGTQLRLLDSGGAMLLAFDGEA
jgi:heat shock protein HslJ